MCVGVPFQCGYGGVVSLCSLKHFSGIKLVSLYSTIKMMHGPINIRWYMRFARCIPKATNILSEYIIFIVYPMREWLREHASILR